MTNVSLSIRVDGFYDKTGNFKILTKIYDVTKEYKLTKYDKLLLSLDEPHNVELNPGKYIIEILMPSGQMLNKQIVVTDSPQHYDILSDRTPHEWLAWQHYSGNINKKIYNIEEKYKQRKASDRFTGVLPIENNIETKHIIISSPHPSDLILNGYFFNFNTIKESRVNTSIEQLLSNNSVTVSPVVNKITRDLIELFSFDSQNIVYQNYTNPNFSRHYLLFTGRNFPVQYCVLPLPWDPPARNNGRMVDVLLMREDFSKINNTGSGSGHRVSITVWDPVISSILGYVKTGRYSVAQTVLEKAENYLFAKMMNPMAASAGTYVLLQNRDLQKKENWQDWVKNLMNWFSWLPDGAIQYGWLKIHQINETESVKEATNAFLEGYRRGLPIYSMGVRMLLEGLTIVSQSMQENDEYARKVLEALSVVRNLAIRTNMEQPFTSVLLNNSGEG